MTSSPTTEWESITPTGVVHDVPTSMDPVVRALWVAALRSDQYPQGVGFLRKDDLYCPLGVLTDLAVHLEVVKWERVDGTWFIPPHSGGNSITPPIYDWAGFTGMHLSEVLPLMYDGERHPIWRLNDWFKLPFTTIADLIEEQY